MHKCNTNLVIQININLAIDLQTDIDKNTLYIIAFKKGLEVAVI